jgi:hypothetical protein
VEQTNTSTGQNQGVPQKEVLSIFLLKTLRRPTPYGVLFLFILGLATPGLSQSQTDTLRRPGLIKKIEANKNFKTLLKAISHSPPTNPLVLNEKSEESYLKYQGKIIRKIIIKHLGFDKTVLDTARTLKNYISKTANKLHTNTKEYVIRNNLFIKEGKPLNPYRLADNERLLRNINFMLDSRIYVRPISKTSDSVDILVVTRDVFSLGGSFTPSFPTKYQLSIQDVNTGGQGQTVQFGQVFDLKRNPNYGYEGSYGINNINGSFIGASIGYTSLNDGISIGNENESSFYINLTRPLYQPFARFAGGVQISYNRSNNVYLKPDSAFARYTYTIQDNWLGYSFGHKGLPNDLKENRNRKFIAIRGYNQHFLNSVNTNLTELDRFVYRDITTVLAQLTFFRQDFYKTQYVLGFGRTEDVPYGYRLSFTSGWERELGNQRPYLGSELYYNKVKPSGTILTYDINLASYFQGANSQDAYASFNFSSYSKIYKIGKMIVRNQLAAGYAVIVNQKVKRGLDIRDVNGVLGFLPDSLLGFQRATFSQETTVFTPYKVLGFHIAPIVRIDLALIRRFVPFFQSGNFFSGYSVGIRARNENLIFNTIEARLFYYPSTVELLSHFKLSITTNFLIKYPSNLVNKPATVFPPVFFP